MEDAVGGEEEEGGGGAPGWMATFADLMSLLLAFFVLLFSFSSIDDQLYKEVGGSMKDAFGVQSRIVLTGPIMGINHIAMEFSMSRPDPDMLNVLPQENLDLRKKWNSDQLKTGSAVEEDAAQKKAEKAKQSVQIKEKQKKKTSVAEEKEKARKTQDTKTGQAMGKMKGLTESKNASVSSEELAKAAQFASRQQKQLGKELAAEIANGSLSVETEGNKVIIRVTEDASFPPGSSRSFAEFDRVIERISNVVKDSPGKVAVEGHTDNIPVSNAEHRSNWDLSASRAVTVVHGLINATGLPVNRFQVRGMADTRPLATNRTVSGRAKNRRVEVILEYDGKDLVPPELKKDVELTDIEKEEKIEEEKEEADPLLDLYRGFDSSLKDSKLGEEPSSGGSDLNLIFRDDFFR